MEKPQQVSSLKPLSSQEWETLIDDYQYGDQSRCHKWTSANYTGFSLLDLSLSSILRKDFPINLKLHISVFIEEYLDSFHPNIEQALVRLVDTLRSVIQVPIDGVSVTYSLKEQLMISTTSTFINCTIDDSGKLDGVLIRPLDSLIELLLTVINRPNHGPDRQTRAVACECLRELERACPSLLSEIAEHLWGLCQNERTHAAQSYVLLFGSVIHGIVMSKVNVSITNTTIPLLPFNVPQFLINDDGLSGKEISGSSYKELRKAISFLLEWPQNLTACGLVEFMCIIMPVAAALELQVSLLKVKFSSLLYTYDPLLCHAFLGMYLRFLDAFDGQENDITSRLVLISKEAQHQLVYRLLALHWLLGLIGLISSREVGKKKAIVGMSSRFYPALFDPLSLKSLKLDLLGYCSILIDHSISSNSTSSNSDLNPEVVDSGLSVVKLFEDGLVSVSGFKWLPPWSTETAVAFRTFHKFLIGASSHSDTDSSSTRTLMESTIFHNLQRMLVEMMLEFRGLVPVIVAFIDRLLSCYKHRWLGERLLQTLDEHLVSKVKIDYRLGSYFPVFDRIAENDTVPPGRLLELLTKFVVVLIEKHGPDTGLKSWSRGSNVLGICRTMLLHHHSSRLFLGLSRLLAFTSLYFPDLEVRDNARIYLRMLICIPGKRLRHILETGGQLPGISQSPHSFSVQSPRYSHDLKKSKNISSYIHLERIIPLLVKQSWSLSLSLSTLAVMGTKPSQLEPIKDNENLSEPTELDTDTTIQTISETKRIDHPQEPLRVMDSKFADIVMTLRRHFSSIPDFRHMPGFKITIYCSLRFESEPFNRIWGVKGPNADDLDGLEVLPAIYATVLTFSSSAPYGSIPSFHVPFLIGEPPKNNYSVSQTDMLAIIPVESNNSIEDDSLENFRAPIMVELEPREPVPGLVDVSVETNVESGEIIRGNLQSITVGIEDMFLKPIVPEDIQGDAVRDYTVDLFDALWEACGTSSSTGRETFPLKGGKGVAAISGTRSVKLLEVHANTLIHAVEHHLAPFVVSVIGEPLVNIVKDRGIIKDVIWKYSAADSLLDVSTAGSSYNAGPLYLKDKEDEEESGTRSYIHKRNMGNFNVLIFLPPRFHLLFQMEVSDNSTLVRIRTDHWPCLAYIDEYLEALLFG